MAGSKEIRTKIKSVQSTRKITKAMEMVAASKMKKSQDRMRASRPYVLRTLQIALHVAKANTEYRHPFLVRREGASASKRVGAIVVTTDKGLCGGLNTNVLRLVLQAHKEWRGKGLEVDYCAIGSKGLGFLQRMGANVVSSATQLGDRPHLEKLVGPVKVLLDKYVAGELDQVDVFFTVFVNTMRQEARHGHMLPIPEHFVAPDGREQSAAVAAGTWDYIYEPDAQTLLDGILRRYVESLVFQMINENMASENSARMVAMKAASDNAATIIDELQLIYNKSRQAAITKELAEIVGGAAAV
jgi:F-type H+-transporting ATPase subunit gamma